MKKKGVAYHKKKADKAWSVFIRARGADGEYNTCFTCGVVKLIKELQCGHFVKRSVSLLRYDPLNCQVQCYMCNVMRYGEQFLFAQNLDKQYGAGTAEKLMDQRFSAHRFTVDELQQIIATV